MDAAIALFPLGSPLLPGMTLPLHIFEARYRQLVDDLLHTAAAGRPAQFGVVCIREGHEVGQTAATALADIGCVAQVRVVTTLPQGRFQLLAIGGRRFRVHRVLEHPTPYLQAEVSWLAEPMGDAVPALAAAARTAFTTHSRLAPTAAGGDELPDDPTALSYALAAFAALPPVDRQRLLAAPSTAARLSLLLQLLAREEALLRQLGTVPASAFTGIASSPN